MTFLELQKLALSRVGDVDIWDGATPTITPDEGYDLAKLEVNTAYTHAVNMLTRKGFFGVVNDEIIKFPASTREIDLGATGTPPTAPTEAPRAILYAGTVASDDATLDSTPMVFPKRGAIGYRERYIWRRGRTWGSNWFNSAQLLGYLRGATILGLMEIPASDVFVKLFYAPTVAAMSADADLPVQVPAEFHEFIAVRAAVMLAGGERSAGTFLFGMMQKCEEDMIAVAGNVNRYSPNVPGSWQRYG